MPVDHVHIVRAARPGKALRWYIYAWRGGPQIRVAEQAARPRLTQGDIAVIAEAQAARGQGPKDTIAALSIAWRGSPEWAAIAASTRALWSGAIVRIEQRWGEVPLRLFGDPRMVAKVVQWRDTMAATPRAADQHVKVLRLMLAWGRLRGMVMINAAAGVPALWRGGHREEIIWLPEDCAAFDAVAPQWLSDARRLAELTGLRRADLVALRWDEVFDTHIARTAAKKSRGRRQRATMPIVPGLKDLLQELRTRPRAPGVETVLAGALGRPIAATTLTTEFNRWRKAANQGAGIFHPGQFGEADRAKHLHDLRGTYATHLMTMPGGGVSDDEIERIMGWAKGQASSIRRRYIDEATVIVALANRLAAAHAVKRIVKRGRK